MGQTRVDDPVMTGQPELGVWASVRMVRSCLVNWPTVVARIAARRLLKLTMGGIPEIRTRAGSMFTVPSGDKTWWTIVEVFGQDSYQLADLALDGGAPVVVDVG